MLPSRRTRAWTVLTVSLAVSLALAAPGPAAASRGEGGPFDTCVPVPTADDRCEAWRARYGQPGGINESVGLDLGGGEVMAAAPDGSAVYTVGAVDQRGT